MHIIPSYEVLNVLYYENKNFSSSRGSVWLVVPKNLWEERRSVCSYTVLASRFAETSRQEFSFVRYSINFKLLATNNLLIGFLLRWILQNSNVFASCKFFLMAHKRVKIQFSSQLGINFVPFYYIRINIYFVVFISFIAGVKIIWTQILVLSLTSPGTHPFRRSL